MPKVKKAESLEALGYIRKLLAKEMEKARKEIQKMYEHLSKDGADTRD